VAKKRGTWAGLDSQNTQQGKKKQTLTQERQSKNGAEGRGKRQESYKKRNNQRKVRAASKKKKLTVRKRGNRRALQPGKKPERGKPEKAGREEKHEGQKKQGRLGRLSKKKTPQGGGKKPRTGQLKNRPSRPEKSLGRDWPSTREGKFLRVKRKKRCRLLGGSVPGRAQVYTGPGTHGEAKKGGRESGPGRRWESPPATEKNEWDKGSKRKNLLAGIQVRLAEWD